MKNLITAFIVISIIGLIAIILLSIYIFIKQMQISYLNRKNALYELAIIRNAYENLMFARRKYYEAKSCENLVLRENLEKQYRAEYKKAIKFLNMELKFTEFLSDLEREELNEILSRPRYELI